MMNMKYKIILRIVNGFFGFIFLVVGFMDLLIMDHSWWHIMGDIVIIINGIFIYALIYISAKKDVDKRITKS
jgi:hypothetical protein